MRAVMDNLGTSYEVLQERECMRLGVVLASIGGRSLTETRTIKILSVFDLCNATNFFCLRFLSRLHHKQQFVMEPCCLVFIT